LLLHIGVVPNVQISRSLDLEHRWDASQLCWRPVLDDTGRTSIDGIWIAGDGAGISGAEAAVPAGHLAALAALAGISGVTPAGSDDMATERALLKQLNRVRPFLEALYAPAPFLLSPADDTIVCRCEEVTARQVREFVALGCLGPNQAKSYGRCGMGPCQGRYCGLTVSHIIAEARGVPVSEVGYYRLRPPLKPVTLGELASLADEGEFDRVG
jgi:NADPH-dependent 2,4-dienoyl-CoA reductase/sulfur reductase-like enzyme